VKINDSIKKTTSLGAGAAPAGASKSAGKAGPVAAGSDNVQLSSQLKTLTEQVAGASVFDAKKVQEIKAAITEGKFQVNAEKVAEGLVDTVKDLIHKRKA
jgi:negative regulator of flagellin synthesis FlgM